MEVTAGFSHSTSATSDLYTRDGRIILKTELRVTDNFAQKLADNGKAHNEQTKIKLGLDCFNIKQI